MSPSTPFQPLPLLGNRHIQTILGNLFRASDRRLPTHTAQLPLPDGDALVLHTSQSPRWQPGEPIVVLVHGLGSSAQSGSTVRVAQRLWSLGGRVVRLDLRGAGAGWHLARRTYNAASSADVRLVLEHLHQENPDSPLYLLGFSLGGNVVLKLAGEAAQQPVPGLARVAALSAPIDLEHCSALLASPSNRFYDRYFVRRLKEQIAHRELHLPDLPRTPLHRAHTLRQIDELYTAPLGGFRDALDYYRQASAFPLIPQIACPALLITARDDPFIAVAPYETLPATAQRSVLIAERGGHLGFLDWRGRWAERVLVEWLTRPM